MNGWFGYAIGELGYPISSEKEEREETEDSSHEWEILEEKKTLCPLRLIGGV